ncbi:hypothetical protein ACFSS8_11310 [Paracoccus kondratievae]
MTDLQPSILRGEVKVRGLSKSYALNRSSLSVLRNLDLDVNGGEILAIVGPRAAARPRFCGYSPDLNRPTGARF